VRRRDFITLLGGAAAAWPLAARAQQSSKKLPTVGVLGAATPSAWSHWLAAFVQRLSELGWTEGRTVAIEYRWAEGRTERFPEIAAEFVRMNVDVIVTAANGVLPAKRASSTIPIVFVVANDPVGTGLVESLARPRGNATGLSIQSSEAWAFLQGLGSDLTQTSQSLATQTILAKRIIGSETFQNSVMTP
jgi:putative ABC transport system substrate-binding protein